MKLINRIKNIFKRKKKDNKKIDPNKTHEEYYKDFQNALEKDLKTYKKNKGK